MNYFKDFCFLVLLGNNFAISSAKHQSECLIESIKKTSDQVWGCTKPARPNIACCNELVYTEHRTYKLVYAANLKCFSRFCTKMKVDEVGENNQRKYWYDILGLNIELRLDLLYLQNSKDSHLYSFVTLILDGV